MNRNVLLNLLLAALTGMADSIWSGTLLVAFLSEVTNRSNTKVGLVTALQGATQLVTALPAGWAADRYPRSRIIAFGGIGLLLSISATSYAVISSCCESARVTFVLLCLGLALFGFSGGVINGPAQALLADSIPTGFREVYYNYLFMCYMLGGVVGPLLSIVLFTHWQGYSGSHADSDSDANAWPMGDLRIVILVGLALEVPCGALMFLFRDDRSLGKESEGLLGAAEGVDALAGKSSNGRNEMADASAEQGVSESDRCPQESDEVEEVRLKQDDHGGDSDEENEEWRKELVGMTGFGGLLTTQHVPYITFSADLLISLASGMTIKFFPLFFKDDCNMSAAEVQTIYLIVPVSMALCSTIGTKVSGYIGRVQACGILRAMGLSCFGMMLVLYNRSANSWLIVLCYVLRTAFMNSTYPLEESILMDYVPKQQRARWKSLESVSQFGWCGSAALGGYLADRHGYTFTFIVTICMQASATCVYMSLITIVSKKRPSDFKSKIDAEDVSGKQSNSEPSDSDRASAASGGGLLARINPWGKRSSATEDAERCNSIEKPLLTDNREQYE
ncbi:hypothetical protein CYMTET_56184 [Cymbomonas tetramitiformis]|uniref:Major facilitator superfamily (MFS) profile domain-containing protein n=1 Tax=Cymbomonas tetramitiformis TaxID=36881 RepID=A0AAE0BBS5_9CHLO|nr:hypothetical protein CYMTET_56184 [Cymbomonas tetramitiformis]